MLVGTGLRGTIILVDEERLLVREVCAKSEYPWADICVGEERKGYLGWIDNAIYVGLTGKTDKEVLRIR